MGLFLFPAIFFILYVVFYDVSSATLVEDNATSIAFNSSNSSNIDSELTMIEYIGAIKIVDGARNVDKSSREQEVDGEKIEHETHYDLYERDIIYGPESLYFLQDYCFIKTYGNTEYSFCGFRNVTRVRGNSYSSKRQLLGQWGNWKSSVDTSKAQNIVSRYEVMEYKEGRSCGNGYTTTLVQFECDGENLEIKSVDDSEYCKYKITFSLPFSCSLLDINS